MKDTSKGEEDEEKEARKIVVMFSKMLFSSQSILLGLLLHGILKYSQ